MHSCCALLLLLHRRRHPACIPVRPGELGQLRKQGDLERGAGVACGRKTVAEPALDPQRPVAAGLGQQQQLGRRPAADVHEARPGGAQNHALDGAASAAQPIVDTTRTHTYMYQAIKHHIAGLSSLHFHLFK
jgi:hypothetical protein